MSEVRMFGMEILEESEKYDKIVRDWIRKKPMYDRQIQHLTEQIASLKQQVEDLIIERIGDREHAQVYNAMIEKREQQIAEHENKIAELKEYEKISKQRKEQLKNTHDLLEDILEEGYISDTNLRMLVKRIYVHQNGDKSLDIKIEMNGNFSDTCSVTLESSEDYEPLEHGEYELAEYYR